MNKGMAQILDDCLDKAVLKTRPGGTLEECLAEYKIVKMELEPLLKTASHTRQSFSGISPSADFNARALTNLLNRAEQMRVTTRKPAKREASFYLPGFKWVGSLGKRVLIRRGWAMAMAVLLALFMVGGTVGASLNASPQQVLYPVKLGTEQVQLKLTSDLEQKARLYMKFADRRVNEMALVAEAVKPEEIDKLETKLAENLGNARAITEELKAQPSKAQASQKLQEEIITGTSNQITTLRRSVTVVQPEAGKRLEIVIDRTLIGFTVAPEKSGEPAQVKEEKPATSQPTPEGRAVPAGPDSGGRRWEIRQK